MQNSIKSALNTKSYTARYVRWETLWRREGTDNNIVGYQYICDMKWPNLHDQSFLFLQSLHNMCLIVIE